MKDVQSSKASDHLAAFLEEKGVRHAFGIIGSGNAHTFDSIARRGFTEIVCVHHEQAAVMAAMMYFRTTGRIATALVTTGAGSANAFTGVLSAWMDSIPVLVISGNENSRFTFADNPLRIWGIQGYDSSQTVSRMTKFAGRVTDAHSICAVLEDAYTAATDGRPGPVWIDVPMNIQATPVGADGLVRRAHKAERPRVEVPAAVEVAGLLSRAERPVFWLGHGIRLAGAIDRIEPLLERIQAPALVSWAGIDMVDSDHPRVFGRAGIYGQRSANFVLQNADLVVAIGTRLAIPQVGYDLSELARAAKIISVDIDPAETTKHVPRVALPICADARDFLDALLDAVPSVQSYPEWLSQCNSYYEEFPWIGPEHSDRDGFINSYRFMDRLVRHLKDDQVIVTDMGTALLSGHQVLRIKPGQRLMTSTGLGEMGVGLPGAIGASFARDRGEVLCLNCDGGMMLNLQELQTIVHHRLPIKIVVFNNDGYLMIKHTQKSLFQGRYAGTDRASGVSCPDYTKLAHAFGLPAFQIRTWQDFNDVIPKLQTEAGPAICEVFMHPEQFFHPKLGLVPRPDGSIVSPPIEDLTPLLPRPVLRKAMIIGMHPKSEEVESEP